MTGSSGQVASSKSGHRQADGLNVDQRLKQLSIEDAKAKLTGGVRRPVILRTASGSFVQSAKKLFQKSRTAVISSPRTAGMKESRLRQIKMSDVEQHPQKLTRVEGKSYGKEVDNLQNQKAHLEAEIKRLSTQVLQITGENDALKKHSKHLGDTLKQVRKAAEENHIKDADLGVDLHRSFSISESRKEAETEEPKEAHPRLVTLRLMAMQSGWLIDPKELQLGKKIGEGATADIYMAIWHGLEVAVKCLRSTYMTSDENSVESFVQEVELLSRQRHPYILHMFGACFDYPDNCWVVSEMLPNGTLTEWLHGEKGRPWKRAAPLPPLKERVRMATEISLAMQYLHEQHPMVIHRDLKPSNVFVDAAMHVRVADFGFARFLQPAGGVMTGETGTYIYMAPEVVKHEQYTEKCDIYSFGIMMCELLTGNPPYIDTYLTPVQMAVGVAEGSLRPKLPHQGVDPSLVSLVSSCWAQDESKRPSFSQISVLLGSHLKELSKQVVEPAVKDTRGGFFAFMHSAH